MRLVLTPALVVLGAVLTLPAATAQDGPHTQAERIEHGERLYRQTCSACHSLNANRIGPYHRSVFGRQAGTVDGYPYSEALRRSELVWSSETLDAWLENPTRLVPGTSMGTRVRDPAARRAIIAYLRSQTETAAD